MTDQDLDALAGEYVLGTLAGEERQALEARIERDSTCAHGSRPGSVV